MKYILQTFKELKKGTGYMGNEQADVQNMSKFECFIVLEIKNSGMDLNTLDMAICELEKEVRGQYTDKE